MAKIITHDDSADNLRGFYGACVAVLLGVENAKDAPTKEAIQSKVELALRRNSVRVVEIKKYAEGAPILGLEVQVITAGPAYYTEVSARIGALYVPAKPTQVITGAIVWRDGGIAFGGADNMLKSVERFAESFALDYLKANPKK